MAGGWIRRRFAFLTFAVAVGLLVAATPAAAHADFVSSTPSPYDIWNVSPTYVSVTVSESVQPGSPTIEVTNGTGARVDRGPASLSASDPTTFRVSLLSGIGPSVYTVTWSVIAADDGHFTAGTFYFMVAYRNGTLPGKFPATGNLVVQQPVSPLEVALQAADFVGLSIAFGGSLLAAVLWIPFASSLEPTERSGPAEGLRALLRLARLGAVVVALAAAALWAGTLIAAPPGDLGGAFGSLYRLSAVAQLALAAAIVLFLSLLLARPDETRAFEERPWEFLPILFCGFAVILAMVAASHSTSLAPWWPLGPVADAVHLYGAALWVGGLLAIVRVRPWLRPPTPRSFSEGLLRSFSNLAFLGVFLIVSAGVLLAFLLVGTVDALVGTGYGWVVLAKASLLAPMIALGVWNRRELGGGHAEAAPETAERVTRAVRAEAVLGAAVLVLAGLLVVMNPASAPPSQNPTFTLDATTGGLYALFQVNPYPAAPGDYIFQLTAYYEGNMTPYVAGGNGTIAFLLEGGNGTWVTLALEGPHGNHYFVASGVLDAPGTWQVRAEIRGPQGTPVDFTFPVTLHP